MIGGFLFQKKSHRKSSGLKNQSNYGLYLINLGYSQTLSEEY